ncbi:hypothetical protein SAMN05660443_1144 [Marinospirillum celere]|uniref:Uncharacterized protein n=2 Tax=Marinospirillum celere TaxID=1122252 RepID=A0A1I1FQ96_9GAMM|nr:hypothetical protein SAMN05660443_1144 [Marinospirillum celere]
MYLSRNPLHYLSFAVLLALLFLVFFITGLPLSAPTYLNSILGLPLPGFWFPVILTTVLLLGPFLLGSLVYERLAYLWLVLIVLASMGLRAVMFTADGDPHFLSPTFLVIDCLLVVVGLGCVYVGRLLVIDKEEFESRKRLGSALVNKPVPEGLNASLLMRLKAWAQGTAYGLGVSAFVFFITPFVFGGFWLLVWAALLGFACSGIKVSWDDWIKERLRGYQGFYSHNLQPAYWKKLPGLFLGLVVGSLGLYLFYRLELVNEVLFYLSLVTTWIAGPIYLYHQNKNF